MTTRVELLNKHVALATAERSKCYFDDMAKTQWPWRSGGRCGTLYLSLEGFSKRIGDPHEAVPQSQWRRYDLPLLDVAGKVSAIWYFDTPRGLVAISDYWWNPDDQLSIRAADRRAMRWFHRWAQLHGFRTDKSIGK